MVKTFLALLGYFLSELAHVTKAADLPCGHTCKRADRIGYEITQFSRSPGDEGLVNFIRKPPHHRNEQRK